MEKYKSLSTTEYKTRFPLKSYSQIIQEHVQRFENNESYVGSPLTRVEMIKQSVDNGRRYLAGKIKFV